MDNISADVVIMNLTCGAEAEILCEDYTTTLVKPLFAYVIQRQSLHQRTRAAAIFGPGAQHRAPPRPMLDEK